MKILASVGGFRSRAACEEGDTFPGTVEAAEAEKAQSVFP